MSLQSSFRKLVKATLNATVTEWNAVLQQENTLKYSMNSDQGRLRGIKLKDLELSDVELNEKKSELEIHLNHDYPIESTSRAFRQGAKFFFLWLLLIPFYNFFGARGFLSFSELNEIFIYFFRQISRLDLC